MSNERKNRGGAVLAVMATVAIAGGVQAAGAAPADAAVRGLTRITYPMGQLDSQTSSERTPECPRGMKVIGGGGRVVGPAAQAIRLRNLRPISPDSGSDRFEVVAEEPPGGVAGKWALEGYALCAPESELEGHEIVSVASTRSSTSHKEIVAACPSGKRVLGAGASVTGGTYGVSPGLQMSRASGPLDIARAAAALESTASSAGWQVVSHAVCAKPVGGAAEGEVVHNRTNAIKECSGATKVHSAGGATGDGPNGPVFLSDLYPSADLRATVLRLTGVPTDGLAIQAICA
ncbi:hypothetical protein [Actinomadura sp. 6N118]|uniref:hypothetical protein n=1 Tax=Actinomadura sp. 6N118 TaxID=3375151 RepID=UPI00379B8D97